MCKKNLFRLLHADEIEARVATVTQKGVSVLLYKTARTDIALLDETVGPMNWKCSYTRDNANCVISIWDADKREWVSKEDTGTESNQEAEKGLASDSFKRAGFKWGLGIELYTSPFIWIPADKVNIGTGKTGKPACTDRFTVSKIDYTDARKICYLELVNRKGDVVFTWGSPAAPALATPEQVTTLKEYSKQSGVPVGYICEAYQVAHLAEIPAQKAAATIKNFTKVVSSYAKLPPEKKQFNLWEVE